MRFLTIAFLIAAFAVSASAQTVKPGLGVGVMENGQKPSVDDAVPDENGIKRAVVMEGLDKITGRTMEFLVPLGVPVQFYKLIIVARACHTRPPEEVPETSAFLEIDQTDPETGTQRAFTGWMFASSPAIHALEHPVYDVWVIDCKTNEPKPEAPAAPEPSNP